MGVRLGAPKVTPQAEERVRTGLALYSVKTAAREVGVCVSIAQRLKAAKAA